MPWRKVWWQMPGEGKSIGARGIRAGGGKTGSMAKNHVWGGKLSLDSPAFITLEPDDFRVHPRVLQGILQCLLVLLTIMDLMIREGGAKWCTSFMLVPPSSSLTTPSFHVWARGSEVSFTAYRNLGKFTFSDTGKKFQYEYIPNYERQETRKRTRVTAHQEPKIKDY